MEDTATGNIYQAVIDDLEEKIATLQSTVDSLRSVSGMANGIGSGSPKSSARTTLQAEFGHDAFSGMSIPDAVKKYLVAMKKTVPIPVLSEALLSGGLKSTATNMKENVSSILSRNVEFVRINGKFGLASAFVHYRLRQLVEISWRVTIQLFSGTAAFNAID